MKKKETLNKIIITLVSIASLLFLFFGNHETGLYKTLIILSIIPVMLLPYLFEKITKIEIEPIIKTLYLVFLFFAYFLGSIINFYYIIKPYDKIMHFISGVVTAFLALIILVKIKKYDAKHPWFNILFMILVTLAIASLWEFFEFTNDNIFGKDAQKVLTTGVDDTMGDMIAAFIGSVLLSILYKVELATHKKLFVTKFLEKLN